MSAIHNNEAINEVIANEIIMSRLLNAPRELVWEVFTDPKHLANWWGPFGFTITTHQKETKVDGQWRLTMHGPDGRDYPNKIIYEEVVKPERLVFRHSGDEDSEGVNHVTTIVFKEEGNLPAGKAGKIRAYFKMTFPSLESLQEVNAEYGAVEGGKQTMARLEEYLTKLQSVGK